MASNMRGLQQYISDIRACRVRELEEKRINREMAHIRQKFKEGNLDGYQRKKYLSKVVFTYILGYKVDVGHMEAVNLISSLKYSEKQIGYLALTLLMHENSELVRLVINSIRKDLDDQNEINNCLALHAIANIGGKEMAEALSPDVHRLLISPVSIPFVKKKAALTLLRLYRKHPDVIPTGDWAERIVSIMDDDNLGVALAVTSLVTTMAQDNLDQFESCYNRAVGRLYSLVFDGNHPSDYYYYRVPIPWLQIKLLRLLQHYPPTEEPSTLNAIDAILKAIMENSKEVPKNVQHNNTQNAILFEAINLAIHLNPESTVVSTAAVLLSRFILSKETNVRYLGLDAMAHLAACSDSLEPIKKHQGTIILSLRDRDISVRRRALDLLYSMCDTSNASVIVEELLKYLQIADYGLREELVLKIAILTEKFATEYEWYVDTILKLISLAGDHVADEVWYRVVQIVTNTEDLQPYASRVAFHYLQAPSVHEKLVKPAAYILGEFGHLIANDEGSSPIEQFQALHSKINFCSAQTRALLLSTYVKWANLFPEIKDQLVVILDRYRHVLDAELQQRACEYLALVTKGDDDELLQAVFEEMPPFPSRESALISRLHKKGKDTGDKRTWVIGGKGENKEREAARFKNFRKGTGDGQVPTAVTTATPVSSAAAPGPTTTSSGLSSSYSNGMMRSNSTPMSPPEPVMGLGSSSYIPENIMDSLAGLDLTSNSAQEAPLLAPSTPSNLGPTSPLTTSSFFSQPQSSAPLTHGANIDKWFDRLSYSAEGVLYEDAQIQIGLKSEYHGHLGRVQLYFGNKLSVPLGSFSIAIESREPGKLVATLAQNPTKTIEPLTQVQQQISVECKELFTQPPTIRVGYLAGSLQTLVLRLPVAVTKFIEPVKLGQADFFERWKLIGGPPRECQAIFPIKLDASGQPDVARNNKVITGNKLGVLEQIDPNPVNSVAAGVLHMSTAGKVGCLLRLEPNKEAKLCRVTIRSTNDEVSKQIERLISKPLRADGASA